MQFSEFDRQSGASAEATLDAFEQNSQARLWYSAMLESADWFTHRRLLDPIGIVRHDSFHRKDCIAGCKKPQGSLGIPGDGRHPEQRERNGGWAASSLMFSAQYLRKEISSLVSLAQVQKSESDVVQDGTLVHPGTKSFAMLRERVLVAAVDAVQLIQHDRMFP